MLLMMKFHFLNMRLKRFIELTECSFARNCVWLKVTFLMMLSQNIYELLVSGNGGNDCVSSGNQSSHVSSLQQAIFVCSNNTRGTEKCYNVITLKIIDGVGNIKIHWKTSNWRIGTRISIPRVRTSSEDKS